MRVNPNHQLILDRFITACQTDDRIAAVLLLGSYVKGMADEHSDLDLYVITTDEGYEDCTANRSAFVESLGEPLFAENFDIPDFVFLIFADGSEVEISFARESQLSQVLSASYKVLLDKRNITAYISLHTPTVDPEAQTEKLRRLIHWFWHELSHFTTALARKELWWAQGQLGALRLCCINLTRLESDFFDQEIGEEGYFKIEKAIPIQRLSALNSTYCPMEEGAMLESAFIIVQFFRDLAPGLASKHGINYPEQLDKVIVQKLGNVKRLNTNG
ncbi:MAG TPA: aminoglycoside 6-adenylyltransferase [Anaerolineales bacterium]|nr:aminoglycoside 6-adenylyltransferase [Anaerolineales bacterium]